MIFESGTNVPARVCRGRHVTDLVRQSGSAMGAGGLVGDAYGSVGSMAAGFDGGRAGDSIYALGG
jgi:hypothetical protein